MTDATGRSRGCPPLLGALILVGACAVACGSPTVQVVVDGGAAVDAAGPTDAAPPVEDAAGLADAGSSWDARAMIRSAMSEATTLRCDSFDTGMDRKADMTFVARFFGAFLIRPSETLCYPCAVRRLWRAAQGLFVIIGATGVLIAVVESDVGALGMLVPVVPAVLFAEWRIGKLPPER